MKYFTVSVMHHDFTGSGMCCFPDDILMDEFEIKNFRDFDAAVDYASNVAYPALVKVLKKQNKIAKKWGRNVAQLDKMYEFNWKNRADILIPTEGLEFERVDFDLEKYWDKVYWNIQIREAELKFEDE